MQVRSTRLIERFITHVKGKKSNKNSFKEEEKIGTCFEIIDEEKEEKGIIDKDNDPKSIKVCSQKSNVIKHQRSDSKYDDKRDDHFQQTHKTDIDYNLQMSSVILNDSVDDVMKLHSDIFQKVNKHEWKVITPQRDIRLGLLNNALSKISLVKTINAHLDSVRRIEFLDSSILFSASEDGLIKEWKIRKIDEKYNIEHLNTYRHHYSPILSTAIGRNQYFSGDTKGKLIVLEQSHDSWNFNRVFNTGNEPIWALDYCYRDNMVVSTTPNKVKFWNVDQLSEKKAQSCISSTQNFYISTKWYDYNQCIIQTCDSVYQNSTFKLYDVHKETEFSKINQNNTFSNDFKLLKNEHLLITANDNHTVSIYDTRTPKLIKNFIAHSNSITALDIKEDSQTLITGDMDGSLRLWDLQSFRCIQELTVHRKKYNDSILDIKIQPESPLVVTAGADSTLRLFSLN